MELKTYCIKTIVNNLANVNQLFAVLSSEKEENLRKEAEWLFNQLLNTLWKKMGISITVGISSAKNRLSAESAKEAQEAFLQRMLHGNSNLYFYNDIKVLSDSHFPTSELNMLRQYIERHDVGNIEFLINEIFSDELIKKYNISYLRILWVRIISTLLKAENTTFTKDSKKMEKLVLNFEVLDSFNSLKEFRSYLYSIILEGIQTTGDIDINSKNKIKLAIKYINENYNRDIAINDIAEKFNMSPNYFSAVFKRETSQTTVNFIKDLRLKKACDYLIHSDKSVVDISKEVGYEDSQYFFKVFKKATGQTPLQYRRMHM
jgi:two-component system, response regulator YesN